MAQSLASSPRLPSPPPMAEDQIGPTSPGSNMLDDYSILGTGAAMDQSASRRIRPGTKSEDMLEGPPLVELQEIDSAFQLTEHLKALHASHTRPASSPSSSVPIDKPTAVSLAQPPPGVDQGIWLYELCRFLTQKANALAVGLFADSPPCSSVTCSEMRASEWQYLCAAHDPPKSCCAIDYCCHTLDWAATTLTSGKLFPSRLALGTESATSTQQVRKMTEIFRRVYRIFAHAWFQHRDVFWRVESKTGLYVFFKTVCDEYRLIPEDNYTIPPEAEGIENTPIAEQQTLPSVLRRDVGGQATIELAVPIGNTVVAPGNTTKRHARGMHERSSSVSTVIHEEVEEEVDADAWEQEEPLSRGHVRELEPELPLEQISTIHAPTVDQERNFATGEEETSVASPQNQPQESFGSGTAAEQPNMEPLEQGNAITDGMDVTEFPAGDSDQVIELMNTSEAAAGEEQEASQSVGD